MTYNELSKEIQQLSYRDKFRLAQLFNSAGAKRGRGTKPAAQGEGEKSKRRQYYWASDRVKRCFDTVGAAV
jgi:hypothetical protein